MTSDNKKAGVKIKGSSDTKFERLKKMFEAMKQDRRNIEDYYFEAAKYFSPLDAEWWCFNKDHLQKIQNNSHIFSNVGIISARRTVNFFMSNATPSSGTWWNLRLLDRKIMEDQAVSTWCRDSESTVQTEMRKSLYVALRRAFHDMMTSYGIVFQGYKRTGGKETTEVYYEYIQASTFWRRLDLYGEITECAVLRNVKPEVFRDLFGREPKEKPATGGMIKLLQLVKRNYNAKENPQSSKDYAFSETWMDLTNEEVILESGYKEMPFFEFSMYQDPNSGYPVGVAYDVLPEVKSANVAKKAKDQATAFAGMPPILTAETDEVSRYGKDLRKGSIITGGMNRDGKPLLQAMQGLSDPNILNYQVADDEARVREGMMQNELLQTHSDNMTATAARIVAGERAAMVAPFVNNIMPTLVRLCERHVTLAVENDKLGPPPEILADQDLEIDIVSPMAMQARGHDLAALMEALEYIGGIANLRPEIVASLDLDDNISLITRATGTEDMFDVQKMNKAVKDSQQQQEQQQQMQAATEDAQVSKTQAETMEKVLAE